MLVILIELFVAISMQESIIEPVFPVYRGTWTNPNSDGGKLWPSNIIKGPMTLMQLFKGTRTMHLQVQIQHVWQTTILL